MDVVPVDVAKWRHPPFGAVREGGYVYGRGALDDKDNLTAGLMTMLLLKRGGAQLDRDVILLAEAGEEGSTKIGIELMVNEHFSDIDAGPAWRKETDRAGSTARSSTRRF